MVLVKINISGSMFEVEDSLFTGSAKDRNSLEKLPQLVTEAAGNGSTLVFQRPVTSFVAILEYYQTGELHMPNDVCPASFRKELKFWEIHDSKLQDCCRIKLRCFIEEQSLLDEFKQEIKSNTTRHPSVESLTIRQKVWSVVDNRGSSIYAKIYFGVTLLAVIACILAITLGTDPCCIREAKFCELVEYVSFTDEPLYNALKAHIDLDKCGKTIFDENDIVLPRSVSIAQDAMSYNIKIFVIHPDDHPENDFDMPPSDPHPPPSPKQNDDGATDPKDDDQYDEYTVRKLFLKNYGIILTEYTTLAFFTVDFLLRLWSCPSVLQFYKSALNIIDFAALVGSALTFVITTVRRDQKYETNWVDLLGFIQVFRALRLFRLVKNIRTSQVLSFSLRRNVKGMSILVVFILIFVCTFGSLIFFEEQRSVVPSILDGWWWSIVTLSTVGYGDIVPQTPLGRATGSICAITGIWLLSMTLPIFVNDFVMLHQYPMDNDEAVDEDNGDNNASLDGMHALEDTKDADGKTDGEFSVLSIDGDNKVRPEMLRSDGHVRMSADASVKKINFIRRNC